MARPISAGAYLRRRREAAGLSVRDVALMMSTSREWARFNIAAINMVESDLVLPTAGFVDRLRGAFAFDPFVYRQIAGGIGAPRLCSACGCSGLDACDSEQDGPCAWSIHLPDLCTRCAAHAADAFRHSA